MKTYLKMIGLAAFVLAGVNLQASSFLNSFLTTNSIDGSVASITSWPTNGTSTNAITWAYTNGTSITTNQLFPGLLTGHVVSVENQEHATFVVQGWLVNTGAAATVGFNLTPATTGGSRPVYGGWVGYGINTNLAANSTAFYNDFETSPQNWVIVTLPASTTNWFNYQTNIIMDVQGIWDNAGWYGIYQITNNLGAGSYLQNPNGVAALGKKLIPTPLIGQ